MLAHRDTLFVVWSVCWWVVGFSNTTTLVDFDVDGCVCILRLVSLARAMYGSWQVAQSPAGLFAPCAVWPVFHGTVGS